MTTVTQDHAAITPTTTARAAFLSAGTNVDELMTLANMHIVELKRIYSQIIAFHPTDGGDATNAAALAAILAKL